MNPTHLNQIDAYLRNELSPKELSDFEQLMNTDPSFHEQVKFEESVKDGLSQYRRAELKTRLGAIKIEPAWLGGGHGGNAGLKILAGTIGATLIGVIGYLFFSDDLILSQKATTPPDEMIVSSSFDHPPVQKINTVTLPKVDVEVLAEEESTNREAKVFVPDARSQETKSSETVDERLVEVSRENSEFIPQVVVPQPDDMMHGETFVSPDAEMPDMAANDKVTIKETNSPVTVETVKRKSETLKFKYFDGKLFLYGDFNDEPYEILEINSPTSRKIYLYYNSKYYSISVTDKVQELNAIDDKKLLGELRILRNNKL